MDLNYCTTFHVLSVFQISKARLPHAKTMEQSHLEQRAHSNLDLWQ